MKVSIFIDKQLRETRNNKFSIKTMILFVLGRISVAFNWFAANFISLNEIQGRLLQPKHIHMNLSIVKQYLSFEWLFMC